MFYTTVKAGNDLHLSFNAKSSNGNDVTSETYATRGPVRSDAIYGGRVSLMNLPENSTITISANGDNNNRLEIKTQNK